MTLTEVQKVLEQMRLEKAKKRIQRMEFRKTEKPLVLSEEEKHKMISNTAAAMREDKADAAKCLELKKHHKTSQNIKYT